MDIFITDDIKESKIALNSSISMIMIDLEKAGKVERQLKRNTRISNHNIQQIPKLLSSIDSKKIIVRTDPPGDLTKTNIEKLISIGVSNLMIPMWKTFNQLEEIRKNCEMITNKYYKKEIKIFPLAETFAALESIINSTNLHFPYFHFGLNDLSLEINKKNMFEIFEEKNFILACNKLRSLGISFGIGGIGLPNKEYKVNAQEIIRKHNKLGSIGFIYTRDFNDLIKKDYEKFKAEVKFLKKLYFQDK